MKRKKTCFQRISSRLLIMKKRAVRNVAANWSPKKWKEEGFKTKKEGVKKLKDAVAVLEKKKFKFQLKTVDDVKNVLQAAEPFPLWEP